MQNIGKAIRHFRRKKDISQSDLARATGMTSGYISEIESGKKSGNLRSETLYKIARVLDVEPQELLMYEGAPVIAEKGPKYNAERFARITVLLEGLDDDALDAVENLAILLKRKGLS